MKKTRIAIAQINLTVGDLRGNSEKIIAYIRKSHKAAADIVAFPELAITGYPPEDLLLKPAFIRDNIAALKRAAASAKGITAIIGFVDSSGGGIYNAAAVARDGKVAGVYRKMALPNYGVFDEKRYFKAGEDPSVFKVCDTVFGINICEDMWRPDGPIRAQAQDGAEFIININASPYYAGKATEREGLLRSRAKDNKVHIIYSNLVGGQDELVFDGHSMIADRGGSIVSRGTAFREELIVADIGARRTVRGNAALRARPMEEIYEALKLGLKDYVVKNGFKKVALGLSGGIDSALVAALARDALGKENVTGVFMPTRYSSQTSRSEARKVSSSLGIKFIEIPIDDIFESYLKELKKKFGPAGGGIAEENLQARIRGNTLMAFSNKFGWLILTTGNKSEMSTGYATLYGDMAGGFAVLKDVLKTLVYKLAEYRNGIGRVIPETTISRAPTAELKPGQKDSDTLPPYGTLDKILKAYIEEDMDYDHIVSKGFNKEMVRRVLDMVDKSEYKRRQSPPGIKITPKAFGRDRRMPITNKYK